jgi:predicted amidohydrolase
MLARAAAGGARVVCFPEAWLPGLRGQDFGPLPWERADEQRALAAACASARAHGVTVILGLERVVDGGRRISAVVIGADGRILGEQTKNQLDPSEDAFYVPGDTRRVFDVDGLRFGIAICHEGWRYPETVRWAAARGAQVVFHPQHTGYERDGVRLARWGSPEAPYYEKAMTLRALENTIWFASVNYALRFQESATSIIDPSGACVAHLPYGEEGVLLHELALARATGLLARRYAPERQRESAPG